MSKLLVAVDVDGTLINTEFDDVLDTRVIAALDGVRRSGHELALCTGRNTRSVKGLLEKSGWDPDDLPLVLLNGALVKGGQPYRQLVSNELNGAQIRRLVPLFKKHGTVPMVYGTDQDGGVLHHESRSVNDVLGRYLNMRRDAVGAIHDCEDLLDLGWERALEVGTIDEKDRIFALTEEIHQQLDGQVVVINTRSLLGQGRYYWAEVYCAGSNKGSGLTTLADEMDIDLANVVAIGDNYNDLDMFAVAGCSVAMGNSPDDVKEKADALAADVDAGGAAEVLEKIAAGGYPCAGTIAQQRDED